MREAKLEERQQANQLIASRQEVGELTNQLTESKGRVQGELEGSREQLIAVKLELAEKQVRRSLRCDPAVQSADCSIYRHG